MSEECGLFFAICEGAPSWLSECNKFTASNYPDLNKQHTTVEDFGRQLAAIELTTTSFISTQWDLNCFDWAAETSSIVRRLNAFDAFSGS